MFNPNLNNPYENQMQQSQPPATGYQPPQAGYQPQNFGEAQPIMEGPNIPVQTVAQSPQGGYQPPQGGYQPPQGGYQPPQGGYQPPQGGYQPPQGGYQPPQELQALTGFPQMPPQGEAPTQAQQPPEASQEAPATETGAAPKKKAGRPAGSTKAKAKKGDVSTDAPAQVAPVQQQAQPTNAYNFLLIATMPNQVSSPFTISTNSLAELFRILQEAGIG